MIIPGVTAVVFVGLCAVYYFALNFENMADGSIKLASAVDHHRAKLICGVSLVTLTAILLWNLVMAIVILLLYSNAALLAAGIFEMYALYTWGARLSASLISIPVKNKKG